MPELPLQVTLLTLTAGDLVGELSFLDETPHYASLVAVGATRVFGLEREELEALLVRASRGRLPRDACDRAHGPRDPAADFHADGRAHELHLQAAREVLGSGPSGRDSRERVVPLSTRRYQDDGETANALGAMNQYPFDVGGSRRSGHEHP